MINRNSIKKSPNPRQWDVSWTNYWKPGSHEAIWQNRGTYREAAARRKMID
jgi:hypothetical protein